MGRVSMPSGSPRTLALLLLVVAVPPAATLGWLGLQLLAQDRALLAQRDFERRQAVAAAATSGLQRWLVTAERHLLEDPVPKGMARFTISEQGVRAQPPDRVAWMPVASLQPSTADAFTDAERLEFRGSPEEALPTYEALARSPQPIVRAGGLLRAARVHRAQQRWSEALEAYSRMAGIADVMIAGAPADLQARRAACAVLQEAGRADELVRAATALEADLLGGRWRLDEPAWELTTSELARWLGRPVPVTAERKMFSATAATLWRERRQVTPSAQLVGAGGTFVTVLRRPNGADTLALAVAPTVVHAWIAEALGKVSSPGVVLSVVGAPDQVVVGPAPRADAAAVRVAPSETGLPWTLVVNQTGASLAAAEFAGRRQLLSVGLAAILLLLCGASYFAWRVMRRELAVARLQTDFVSAVSHEFRTPLTSLRHVTELLEESDDVPRERRQALYESLARNTERLRRLVESLLDFSRMESGKRPFDMELLEAGALAAEVVAAFEKEVAGRGFTVALEVQGGTDLHMSGDRSSLTNALWNLLDNAVKYSPDQKTVRVHVDRQDGGVAISVQDSGLGIPPHEQKAVFGRFVRGEQAARLGINGTGLGLALVSQIVEAHGGVVELESQLGAGSTFRLVFPVLAWDASALAERRA